MQEDTKAQTPAVGRVSDIKGGKVAMQTASAVVMEEIRKQKALVKAMAELPPANTPENAKRHRQVSLEFALDEKGRARQKVLFDSLGLDY